MVDPVRMCVLPIQWAALEGKESVIVSQGVVFKSLLQNTDSIIHDECFDVTKLWFQVAAWSQLGPTELFPCIHFSHPLFY